MSARGKKGSKRGKPAAEPSQEAPAEEVSASIDVREGASGASADSPGVGLEMVSVLKLKLKDENQ